MHGASRLLQVLEQAATAMLAPQHSLLLCLPEAPPVTARQAAPDSQISTISIVLLVENSLYRVRALPRNAALIRNTASYAVRRVCKVLIL